MKSETLDKICNIGIGLGISLTLLGAVLKSDRIKYMGGATFMISGITGISYVAKVRKREQEAYLGAEKGYIEN